MRRAWHGETKGKGTAIQSGSSQSEGGAGSERMTRKNEHGGPSPRGSGTLRRVTSGALRRTGGGSELPTVGWYLTHLSQLTWGSVPRMT
jgi:hypothetical protein